MLNEWVFIGLFVAVVWLLPTIPIVLGKILGPKRPNEVKQQTYECGVETYGPSWVQFKASYLIFALVYLVFGIEVAFLAPWAVAYNQLGLFALFEVTVFIVLLLAALVYVWRKGVLEWL